MSSIKNADELIAEKVTEAASFAVGAYSKVKARGYRRAVALGYWKAAEVTYSTPNGIGRTRLHLLIDPDTFVNLVDDAACPHASTVERDGGAR